MDEPQGEGLLLYMIVGESGASWFTDAEKALAYFKHLESKGEFAMTLFCHNAEIDLLENVGRFNFSTVTVSAKDALEIVKAAKAN